MTTPHPSLDRTSSDREALSALFDGELGGDAARFALKRLDHDQDWRATCDRWSLVGDVLRGQGQALLPAGFPARLREAADARASVQQGAAMPRWVKWGGVGLAASVAAVSLFLARQTAQVETPDAPAPLAAASAKPARVDPAPQPAAPRPDGQGAMQLASAGLAAVEVSRQGTQRTRAAHRAVNPVANRRKPAAAETPMVAQASETAVAAATTLSHDAASSTPFTGTPVRPWPRAVLPQLGGSGALTTDFGAGSPSFYPFEPRLPGNGDTARGDEGPSALP